MLKSKATEAEKGTRRWPSHSLPSRALGDEGCKMGPGRGSWGGSANSFSSREASHSSFELALIMHQQLQNLGKIRLEMERLSTWAIFASSACHRE